MGFYEKLSCRKHLFSHVAIFCTLVTNFWLTLDAVITHNTTGCPSQVVTKDVGLSDHFLLEWEVNVTRAERPTVPVCSRPWRRLDIECFRSQLSTSRLC